VTVIQTKQHFSIWDRMVLAEYGMLVRTGVVIRRGGGIVPPEIVIRVLSDAGKARPPEWWA
jgi:hypothetical protein